MILLNKYYIKILKTIFNFWNINRNVVSKLVMLRLLVRPMHPLHFVLANISKNKEICSKKNIVSFNKSKISEFGFV